MALFQLHQTLVSYHSKSPERGLASYENKRAAQTVLYTIGFYPSTDVSDLDILCFT